MLVEFLSQQDYTISEDPMENWKTFLENVDDPIKIRGFKTTMYFDIRELIYHLQQLGNYIRDHDHFTKEQAQTCYELFLLERKLEAFFFESHTRTVLAGDQTPLQQKLSELNFEILKVPGDMDDQCVLEILTNGSKDYMLRHFSDTFGELIEKDGYIVKI